MGIKVREVVECKMELETCENGVDYYYCSNGSFSHHYFLHFISLHMYSILGRERQKWILQDRDGRMKKMVTIFFFGICKCLLSFKMSCHLSFNR